jgi:hypothetical protein
MTTRQPTSETSSGIGFADARDYWWAWVRVARARLAPSTIVGFGIALLSYAVIQLAASLGYQLMTLTWGSIPLFERWRVGGALGAAASILVASACPDRWMFKLAGFTTLVACGALLVVVVFAP